MAHELHRYTLTNKQIIIKENSQPYRGWILAHLLKQIKQNTATIWGKSLIFHHQMMTWEMVLLAIKLCLFGHHFLKHNLIPMDSFLNEKIWYWGSISPATLLRDGNSVVTLKSKTAGRYRVIYYLEYVPRALWLNSNAWSPPRRELGFEFPLPLVASKKKKKYVSLVSCMYIFAFFFLFFLGWNCWHFIMVVVECQSMFGKLILFLRYNKKVSIKIRGDAFRVIAWNFMILTYIKNSIF